MHQLTRRSAILTGALTAASALLPVVPSVAAPVSARRARFEASVGRTVILSTPNGTVRAAVRSVRDLAGFPAGSPAGYAVLLKPRSSVPDGIYHVTGNRLGDATLFFANVGRGRFGGLEAIVSTEASPSAS